MAKQIKSGDYCEINIVRAGKVVSTILGYWTWNHAGTKLIKVAIPQEDRAYLARLARRGRSTAHIKFGYVR